MMQMHFHRKLPIPKDVKSEFPLTEKMKQVKESVTQRLMQSLPALPINLYW